MFSVSPRNTIKSFALTVVVAAAALVGLASGQAKAEGTMYGNWCLNSSYIKSFNLERSGSSSCANVVSFSRNASVTFQPGVGDYLADGRSAYGGIAIEQYTASRGWVVSKAITKINSSGKNYWWYGDRYAIAKASGATHFRFRITSAGYDKPTGITYGSVTQYSPAINWSTGNY